MYVRPHVCICVYEGMFSILSLSVAHSLARRLWQFPRAATLATATAGVPMTPRQTRHLLFTRESLEANFSGHPPYGTKLRMIAPHITRNVLSPFFTYK